MVGVIFYGFLIYLLAGKIASSAVKRWLYAAVSILMLLIGMSRVVTNAHFLSDVIGGYFIGLICLILVIAVYDKLNEFLSAARSKKAAYLFKTVQMQFKEALFRECLSFIC
ncbi:phosphatase PAP2 family protein [Bacillus sp. OVS6]|nr:phosphatase PAP2 family protein [Bacillus sp. OVS6]